MQEKVVCKVETKSEKGEKGIKKNEWNKRETKYESIKIGKANKRSIMKQEEINQNNKGRLRYCYL